MYSRHYETLLLFDPDLPVEELESLLESLTGIIESMDGRILRMEDWGRRRLAYPVKKKMYGQYHLMDYMGTPELLAEFERNLRLNEKVYKFLSQVLDKKFTEDKFQEVLEGIQAEKARREAERAEREAERAQREADAANAAAAAAAAAEEKAEEKASQALEPSPEEPDSEAAPSESPVEETDTDQAAPAEDAAPEETNNS